MTTLSLLRQPAMAGSQLCTTDTERRILRPSSLYGCGLLGNTIRKSFVANNGSPSETECQGVMQRSFDIARATKHLPLAVSAGDPSRDDSIGALRMTSVGQRCARQILRTVAHDAVL